MKTWILPLLFAAVAANAKTADTAFDLTSSANGFGLEGLQLLLEENADKNVAYSPISAHLALGLLLNGAEGRTAEEIASTLKIPLKRLKASNASVLRLLERLNGRPEGELKLSLANGIWAGPQTPLKPEYVRAMKRDFQAEVATLESAAQINRWAAEKTGNLITNVIDDVSGLEAILANATYFKADWTVKFEEARESTFNALTGRVPADLMKVDAGFRYIQSRDFEAVELPYGPGRLASMIVVLPRAGQNLGAFRRSIDAAWLQSIGERLSATRAEYGLVVLPKFEFKTEWKMNDALARMGMPSAFTAAADFRRMSDRPLKISYVKQDAVIKVHEEGTEAAAVTTIGMEATSIPPQPKFELIADRPFFYFIRDNATGVILFAGQVVEP